MQTLHTGMKGLDIAQTLMMDLRRHDLKPVIHMKTASDHLNHQMLFNEEYRKCIYEVYMPDGMLKSPLKHQPHSEHGNDISIKIASDPSRKPSMDLDIHLSEEILPVFDVNGAAFISVLQFL